MRSGYWDSSSFPLITFPHILYISFLRSNCILRNSRAGTSHRDNDPLENDPVSSNRTVCSGVPDLVEVLIRFVADVLKKK